MRLRTFVIVASVVITIIFSKGARADLYWDANSDSDGGSDSDTAAGTWGIDDFWNTDSDGLALPGPWVADEVAVFSAGTNVTGAYTVALDGTQSASGVRFEEGEVTISGGTELTLTGGAAIDVAPTLTATISSVVGGSAGLNKTGAGTLVLGGNNSYTGGTTLNEGVTAVSADSNLGNSGNGITFGGAATLRLDGGLGSVARNFLLNNTGTINTNSNSVTLSGNITGTGGLTKAGGGTLELSGTNTYEGTTTIGIGNSAGDRSVLHIKSSSAFPENGAIAFPTSPTNPQNRLVIDPGVNVTVSQITGGSLNSGGTPNDASNIVVGTGTLTFNTPENVTNTIIPYMSADFDPVNDVYGKVVKNGPGTLSIIRNNGSSAFRGQWIINEGKVLLNDGQQFGSTGNASRVIINGGTLATGATANLTMQTRFWDINGDFTFENTINGIVTQLVGSTGATAGNAVITLTTDNPTITVNTPLGGNMVFAGRVVDDGTPRGFTKDGEGLFTLQNKYNSYRGDTVILKGTLALGINANLVVPPGFPETEGIVASPGNPGGADEHGNYGTVHLSGGELRMSSRPRSLNPADNEFIRNPLNVTADSSITSTNNTAGNPVTTATFSSDSMGGTGGTLTLRNDAAAGGANPTNHRFDVYFTGSGFDFPRPIDIAAGVNANRPTRLNAANTTGTQTFSGPILGPGSIRRTILPSDTPGSGATTVLTGANTYSLGTFVDDGMLVASGTVATFGTGNVTVTGGSLSIMSGVANAIADTATLSLLGGGTPDVADVAYLNLGDDIDERVLALVLNGESKPDGTYGSTASGATYQFDEFFTGTGILRVGAAPTDFIGDYNDDGAVDAADYVMWRHAETDNSFALQNDSANPGFQPEDYDRWVANFGNEDGGGSSSRGTNGAVPEPGAFAIALLGLIWASVQQRRRD